MVLQVALFEARFRYFRNPVCRLYLPDDYAYMEEYLAFFSVYYINGNLISSDGHYVAAVGYTKYRDKDDPAWLATHFPGVE